MRRNPKRERGNGGNYGEHEAAAVGADREVPDYTRWTTTRLSECPLIPSLFTHSSRQRLALPLLLTTRRVGGRDCEKDHRIQTITTDLRIVRFNSPWSLTGYFHRLYRFCLFNFLEPLISLVSLFHSNYLFFLIKLL